MLCVVWRSRYYYAHGIRGVSDEMSAGIAPDETNQRMIGSGLDRLMVYIIGRMLWDVTLDGEELIDEYCGGYVSPSRRSPCFPFRAIGSVRS